ncbi:hypothetical protein PoB_000083800 [Plakobranchus ocellatus]|uniref:Transmembrane protein n=1 Tax=Plakobranchus ocellatus TaxID=259542 RepID=A0AAV3XWH3_9GAST|nr:hypothetical protein PoB_000083800 [Plakobranchus ocellatus]
MIKSHAEVGAGSASRGESDFGATYFPFLGPSPLDTHETSFCSPGPRQAYLSSPGVCADRYGPNRRDAESLNSSPSEVADDNVVSVPMRARPFREAHSLVLVAPPYSPLYHPGFSPMAPPLAPLVRTPSTDSFVVRKTGRSQHMKYMGLKHVVIFMASLFLIAFIAVIFTAVYFGHKLDPDPRV